MFTLCRPSGAVDYGARFSTPLKRWATLWRPSGAANRRKTEASTQSSEFPVGPNF